VKLTLIAGFVSAKTVRKKSPGKPGPDRAKALNPCGSWLASQASQLPQVLHQPAGLLLQPHYILSLQALVTLDLGVFDLLSLCQGAMTFAANGTVMHEHIGAISALNKTVAFGVVEPFHTACYARTHESFPLLLLIGLYNQPFEIFRSNLAFADWVLRSMAKDPRV
jgi:hypothetical protein